jgi:demethylmenaquinone methyltransferase/2-methoxy-6-polyprenyl-1,4-benzoquinol methylase
MHHFDLVAPYYDFMNNLLSFGIQNAWKRQAIRMLGLNPGDRVLDVCGGTGDLALLAARRTGPEGRVVVYDLNRSMLAAGLAKLAASEQSDAVCCVQGDAECIAFADGTFDAALVGFGIRNLTHLEKGFREMHRVLKPGGRFLCLEFSKPVNPVFRALYDLYSFYIMPLAGRLVVGNRQGYACLPQTIRLFPLPDELARILEKIGFTKVVFRRMTNGIAVAHTGTKSG